MLVASSVFAFAEASSDAQNTAPAQQPCAQKRVCKAPHKGECPRLKQGECAKKRECNRPKVTPEQRRAFVQRILLSLSAEDLAKLAEQVASVQKMTPEEKESALKALPKPEFRRGDAPKARGFHHHPMPRGKMCRAPFPPRAKTNCGCCKGAPLPPPPAPEVEEAPEVEKAPEAPVAE